MFTNYQAIHLHYGKPDIQVTGANENVILKLASPDGTVVTAIFGSADEIRSLLSQAGFALSDYEAAKNLEVVDA